LAVQNHCNCANLSSFLLSIDYIDSTICQDHQTHGLSRRKEIVPSEDRVLKEGDFQGHPTEETDRQIGEKDRPTVLKRESWFLSSTTAGLDFWKWTKKKYSSTRTIWVYIHSLNLSSHLTSGKYLAVDFLIFFWILSVSHLASVLFYSRVNLSSRPLRDLASTRPSRNENPWTQSSYFWLSPIPVNSPSLRVSSPNFFSHPPQILPSLLSLFFCRNSLSLFLVCMVRDFFLIYSHEDKL